MKSNVSVQTQSFIGTSHTFVFGLYRCFHIMVTELDGSNRGPMAFKAKNI